MIKITDFIIEARKTIKRKYTELHPKKQINSNAKTRNKIITKLGEHSWQVHEIVNYLSETDENDKPNASKQWFKTNKSLFTFYEQGDAKMCKLSKKGLRILKEITIND